MAVGVVVDGALAIENVGKGFEGEVALEGLFGIIFLEVLGALFLVDLCFEKFLADEGGGFGAGAGEGAVIANGVSTVGHFYAVGEGAIGEFDGEVFDGISFAEFEVEGLAGEEVAGAGHEVDSGDAAGAGLVDRGVPDVDGVEDADLGLDGRGGIGTGNRADVGVGADEAGDDGLSGGVDALGICGDVDLIGRADGDDGVAFEEESGVFDLRRRDRVDGGVGEGLDFEFGFRGFPGGGVDERECDEGGQGEG